MRSPTHDDLPGGLDTAFNLATPAMLYRIGGRLELPAIGGLMAQPFRESLDRREDSIVIRQSPSANGYAGHPE